MSKITTHPHTNRVPQAVVVFLFAAYAGLPLSTVDHQHQMAIKHRERHGPLAFPSRHVENQSTRGVHTHTDRDVRPADGVIHRNIILAFLVISDFFGKYWTYYNYFHANSSFLYLDYLSVI